MTDMRTSIESLATPEVRRTAQHLGQLVRTARLARQMTQAELAVRSKTSPATVRRVEKGSVEAGLGNVLLMMEQLGLLKQLNAVTDPASKALIEQQHRKRARRARAPDMDF